MRILFLTFDNLEVTRGISKKIIQQKKSLEKISTNLDFIFIKKINKSWCRINNNIVIRIFSKNKVISFFQRYYTFKDIYNIISGKKYDLIYIRYNHIGSPFFIYFLSKLKKECNILALEIPTFPYDLEYSKSNILLKIQHFIEKKSRDYFYKYVDKIITYSACDYIYKIPTIKISNGIDLENIPLSLNEYIEGDCLNLICVASMEFWHGYDRVLLGLSNYKKNNPAIDIKIYLVGPNDNATAKLYKDIVIENSLNNNVFFLGRLDKNDLDILFKTMHIAIGCLGCHRKGIINIKSLKNREYCARGIPFIYSENDSDFDDKPYVYKILPNDDPIDLVQLLDWYKQFNHNPAKMRDFVKEFLTWDVQMNIIKKSLNK